jgi:hypothetical protein
MKRLSILAVSLLTGCASTADCGPDWFATGQRDGRINAGSQAERYAARCGGSVDRARYQEGYAEGFSHRPTPGW